MKKAETKCIQKTGEPDYVVGSTSTAVHPRVRQTTAKQPVWKQKVVAWKENHRSTREIRLSENAGTSHDC